MKLSGMLSRCMVPFEGWNARGQGFEHPLCIDRFVSPFEPFIGMTAVCAGAPCTTRRLSTAATKKTNLSKIRCVTKPVADAKRTLSAVQSRLPDDVVHAVHQRPAPCKHRQEDDIIPSQTRRGGGRSDEPELGALEDLFETAVVSSRAHPPSS